MPKLLAEFANRDNINFKKQGKKPNLNNPNNINKETINRYILYCQNYYKGKYNNTILQEYFREDFDGQIKEIFVLSNT